MVVCLMTAIDDRCWPCQHRFVVAKEHRIAHGLVRAIGFETEHPVAGLRAGRFVQIRDLRIAVQFRSAKLSGNSCLNQGRGRGFCSFDCFDFGAAQRARPEVQTNECCQQTDRAAPLRELAEQGRNGWGADNSHGYVGGNQVGCRRARYRGLLPGFEPFPRHSASFRPPAGRSPQCPALNFC
jgi:hypothetical protein